VSKKRYICLIKDDYGDGYGIGQGVTTNLPKLKKFQAVLKQENVECKIFQLKEII
jgi:hypothetical protein